MLDGIRKHHLGDYKATEAPVQKFLRHAAGSSAVMGDYQQLSRLPQEVLKDILEADGWCDTEFQVFEVGCHPPVHTVVRVRGQVQSFGIHLGGTRVG